MLQPSSTIAQIQILLFLADWELIWASFMILYWRAVTNLGLGSWSSAPKLNGPSHASWLLIFPLSLPSQAAVILPSYGIPCQLQLSLISKVLISSDCQNILARVALNFLAPLRLGVCGLGLSISSLVQDPHEVSSLPSQKAALQKHLLCQTRSWSTAPSQPMLTPKRKKHCNKLSGVWGYLLMQHNLTCLGSFTFPLSNLNLHDLDFGIR